jgi:hypothetical protein
MLTLKQTLAISLRQPGPPWSTSALRSQRKSKPTSLRSFAKDIGDQQLIIFIDVRSITLLSRVATLEELRAKWNDQKLDQETLDQLARILGSSGASIVYQSKDRKTIGIKGAPSSLGKLGAIQLNDKGFNKDRNDALSTIGQGGGTAAASVGVLAAASAAGAAGTFELFIVVSAFLGFGFAGLVLGSGIAALIAASGKQSVSTPKPSSPTTPDIFSVFGRIPDNLTSEMIDELIQTEFGVDLKAPEPGQLPGAGDLSGGEGPGGFPGSGSGDGGSFPV